MKRHNKSKGQSIVETALILPVLLLILTGIIDFGLMFSDYLLVINASREAARYAAVGYTNQQISDMVAANTTLDITKLTIDFQPPESTRKKGEEITVTVKYDHDLFTPIISSIVPDPMRLTGKTVMRME